MDEKEAITRSTEGLVANMKRRYGGLGGLGAAPTVASIVSQLQHVTCGGSRAQSSDWDVGRIAVEGLGASKPQILREDVRMRSAYVLRSGTFRDLHSHLFSVP